MSAGKSRENPVPNKRYNPFFSMTHWTKYHKRSIILICAVCTLLAAGLRCFPTFEYGTRDLLISHGKKAVQDPDLMFLAIDSPSLNVGATLFKDDIEKS